MCYDDSRVNYRFATCQDPVAHPVVDPASLPVPYQNFECRIKCLTTTSPAAAQLSRGSLGTSAFCMLRPTSSIHCSLDLRDCFEIRLQIV